MLDFVNKRRGMLDRSGGIQLVDCLMVGDRRPRSLRGGRREFSGQERADDIFVVRSQERGRDRRKAKLSVECGDGP